MVSNNYTGETSYQKPPGFVPPSAGLAGALHAPLLKAALRLQRRFRAHRARKAVLARRGARFAESALPSATWVAAEDPRSGTKYVPGHLGHLGHPPSDDLS